MCTCAGWYRKKPLRVSVCFPLSHCECLNHNSTGHLLQMAPQPTSPLSGGRTPMQCPPLCPGAQAWSCSVSRWSELSPLIWVHPHTHTVTSPELAVLLISCPAAYDVRTSFCPHFNLSTFCCLSSSTGLQVGHFSIQGVGLDRIICCSVSRQMSPWLIFFFGHGYIFRNITV